VATRLSAAALTLAGVAFLTGTGLLLSNQPTTTALAEPGRAIAVPQAIGGGFAAGGVGGIGAATVSGVTTGPGRLPGVPGQTAGPAIGRVAVTQSGQGHAADSPGGAPVVSSPRVGQGEPAPGAPATAPKPVGARGVPVPPAVTPPVAVPRVAVPPAVVPAVTVPAVTVPPAAQPIGLIPRVVSVVDPVVSTVGSLLGAVL
jgi:hypothetical protein